MQFVHYLWTNQTNVFTNCSSTGANVSSPQKGRKSKSDSLPASQVWTLSLSPWQADSFLWPQNQRDLRDCIKIFVLQAESSCLGMLSTLVSIFGWVSAQGGCWSKWCCAQLISCLLLHSMMATNGMDPKMSVSIGKCSKTNGELGALLVLMHSTNRVHNEQSRTRCESFRQTLDRGKNIKQTIATNHQSIIECKDHHYSMAQRRTEGKREDFLIKQCQKYRRKKLDPKALWSGYENILLPSVFGCES